MNYADFQESPGIYIKDRNTLPIIPMDTNYKIKFDIDSVTFFPIKV